MWYVWYTIGVATGVSIISIGSKCKEKYYNKKIHKIKQKKYIATYL